MGVSREMALAAHAATCRLLWWLARATFHSQTAHCNPGIIPTSFYFQCLLRCTTDDSETPRTEILLSDEAGGDLMAGSC